MIHELRSYDIAPQHMAAYMQLWETAGYPARLAGGFGTLVGFWVTESGPLNRVVHIWAYESLDKRGEIRAAMAKDPAWVNGFLNKALSTIVKMESCFMKPASFSPIQ